MNLSPDVEAVLREYLADDGSPAPDHILDVVEERIERQRQRRSWRVPWRDSTMNTYLKPIVAIAAVVVAAVAGLALLSQPTGPSVGAIGAASPSPSPTPSVAPSEASSPTPTPAWNRYPVCGSGDPPCAGPVGAGTYTSRGFSVPVTYTLGTPWVNTSDWPDFFVLYPDTPANRALHSRADAEGSGGAPFIFMGPAAVSPSDSCADSTTRMDATGFGDYLESRDGLSVTGTRSITLSGLDGQQLDIEMEPGWTGCLPGTYIPDRRGMTDRLRYIVLDLPSGGSLVISLWDPVDLDRFLTEAMPIVESFEFDLSQLPSPSPS